MCQRCCQLRYQPVGLNFLELMSLLSMEPACKVWKYPLASADVAAGLCNGAKVKTVC